MAAFSAIVILDASFSQRISNVALIAQYMPMLMNPHVEILMVLTVGSTIAGTMLILEQPNVIIIQKRGKTKGTQVFFEFARVGIPLGFVNLLIYWVWFCLMY